MNRKKIAMRNSAIGLLSQIVALLIQFITRTVFIDYLGVELLGISSTFSSVLNTLSLAELGFQSAVVYNLYKPLAEDDQAVVNEIVNVLKIIYRVIGVFFIVAGVCCTPFLRYILTNVEINTTIYVIFYIQVLNSACSYFLAYKRSLLYADRREFMTKIIDTSMNVIISTIKIIVVVKTSNYIYYLTLTTIQTVVSNLIIHLLTWKIYPYLKRTKFNKKIFKNIWNSVKNLFIGKMAYYIYTSTDNIVISAFISTVSVGFVVNYTTITTSLKNISNSFLNPIAPIIGNMLAVENDSSKNESIFRIYTFVRFAFACGILVPMVVLIQSFISFWIGSDYLLSNIIVLLYGMDLFIHIVHSSLCDYINGQGLFKQDRNVEIIGAIMNITISVVLARLIGITGVLIGTIISQSMFWVGRSYIAYKYCFKRLKKEFCRYWLKMASYIVCFLALTTVLSVIYSYMQISIFILRFVVGGITCELIIAIVLLVVFWRTEEMEAIADIIKKNFQKKKRNAV